MTDDLDKFDELLAEHFTNSNSYDEKLFNLGVQLGRILERNSIETYRPKAFIEFDQKNKAYDAKLDSYRRINTALEFLIRNALAKQIEEHGAFTFSRNSSSSFRDVIDDEIVAVFHVQVDRTMQQEYGGSFETSLVFKGQVAEILEKYEIGPYGRVDVDNTTGDEHETIYNPDDVSRIFGASLNLHLASFSANQLYEIADELEKITSWLSLKLVKCR